MKSVPISREKFGHRSRDTQGEEGYMIIQRMDWNIYKPRNTKYCRQPTEKLEEIRKNSCLEPSKEEWPCSFLDFGLLASRNKRKQISVVLNHQVCSSSFVCLFVYSNPRKLIHKTKSIIRDKEGYFIIIKGSIHEEFVMINHKRVWN